MTRLELIMTDARPPFGPDDVEALLKRARRPTPPDDMVAKVRARLAAERSAAIAAKAAAEGADRAPPPAVPEALLASANPKAPRSEGARPVWRRWAVEGLVFAAAAAGLVVAVQVGHGLPKGGNPVAEAAGIAADSAAVVDVHLRAPTLDDALVRRLADEAGLALVEGAGGVAFEGGATDVRRFLVQLRVEAARAGGGVSGFVPDAARLRLVVATE